MARFRDTVKIRHREKPPVMRRVLFYSAQYNWLVGYWSGVSWYADFDARELPFTDVVTWKELPAAPRPFGDGREWRKTSETEKTITFTAQVKSDGGGE